MSEKTIVALLLALCIICFVTLTLFGHPGQAEGLAWAAVGSFALWGFYKGAAL